MNYNLFSCKKGGMEMGKVLNVGVIGAGAISGIYLKNMKNMFDNIQPVSICAAHLEKAKIKADEYGIKACTMDDMLNDPDVDICVVLTPVSAHYEIIKKALIAGKHVYTEKTISETVEQAKELCEIADRNHLYLGSAPDTFLGSAIQTAKKAYDEGAIGEANSFSISINRNNDLLVALYPFLSTPGSGVLRDYEVYYITALVSILGPAKRTAAFVRTPYKTRENNTPGTKYYGQVVETPNETVVAATIELENGIVGTIHQSHETIKTDRADFAIYGKKGILMLSNPNYFGGEVKVLRDIPGLKTDIDPDPVVEVLKDANDYNSNSRGLGVSEMADAIIHSRSNRATKEMAMHVLDVLETIEKSSEVGQMLNIESSFSIPEGFTK